jgi:MFS family permease
MGRIRQTTLHYGWVVVAVSVVVVVAALGFGRFGYTVILPSMKASLGLDAVKAADLATGNMIGYLSFAVISGILAARFGARVVISFFMLVTGASMLLSGLVTSYPVALAARTLTGIGSAGANIPVMALVAVWFVPGRRGLATGITVSGSSFGLVITGLLVPVILRRFGSEGWRQAWFVFAAFAFLMAVLAFVLLRNSPADKGCVQVGGAVHGTGEAVGEKTAADRSERLSGTVPLGRECGGPRLNWSVLYRSRQIWHLAGIYILFGFSYVIYATFFVDYLTSEAGFEIQRAGSLWSAIGMLSVASGFIWGSVSDRLGRKYGLALVFLIQATSYALFGLWRGVPGSYLSALLFAVTAWSVPAIMAASAGDLLGRKMAAAAFGFISLLLSVGQVLGPFLAGRIAALTGSYSYAFITAAAAAALGAAAALLLRMGSARE